MLVLAGSQSPTDSAHSSRRKLTWQQFSHILVIWTGLLNCTTDTTAYARDGQTTCNKKQEKGKEKDICLLKATYSRVSSDEMRAAGSCWCHTAVFLHTALFHTFPPSVLPRMFLSVQNRIIWMSFMRVRSPAFVYRPRIFSREGSPQHTKALIYKPCVYSKSLGGVDRHQQNLRRGQLYRAREEPSGKGKKILLPIYHSKGYKRSVGWEEIPHSSLGTVQGKGKLDCYLNSSQEWEGLGQYLPEKYMQYWSQNATEGCTVAGEMVKKIAARHCREHGQEVRS